MNQELRWDQVRYFLAVAQSGSLVGAARQLGVSHATVMRNIAALEARLELRLFDHVRSGYRITTDGEELLASALGMAEHAETLLRRAMGKNPSPEGVLKLVVADGSLFDPMPLLQRFRQAQPRIELAVENAAGAAEARLAQLHADVAILVTNSPPEDLVGRQLARVGFACFTAAAYLNDRPAGALRAEDCDWVVWRLGSPGEFDVAWQQSTLRRLARRPRVVLQADQHGDAVAAVRAGVGVALLNEALAGDLVRLSFPPPRETVGVWVLTHPDLRRSGRVRAFFDFVAAEFHGSPAPPRE